MRKYLLLLILWTIPLFVVLAYVNLWLDPINVVWQKAGPRPIDVAQRFVKLKFISENPKKYDSFVLGSSRAGKINAQRFLGKNWYNLFYSQSLPEEWLEDLLWLHQKNVHFKNIIICMDDFSFIQNPSTHSEKWVYSKYRDDFLYRAWYYLRVFTALPQLERLDLVLHSKKSESVYYDLYHSGNIYVPYNALHSILSDSLNHINHKTFKVARTYEGKAFEYQNQAIEALKKIQAFALQNQIQLTFVFNPVHKTTLSKLPQQSFIKLKSHLQENISYWDFSGTNSITTNNYWWFETSHPREIVGDFVLARIFNNTQIQVPKDFGIYRPQKKASP